MSLVVVGLLAHESLLLSLEVEQLSLYEFQRFDLLVDMLGIFVGQHSEEDSLEIEPFAPFSAVGFRQLACEDLPCLCLLSAIERLLR